MPTTVTIPLADTQTIAEQTNPYDLMDPVNSNDPVPFHPSDVISMALRPVEIQAIGDDPIYLQGDMSVTYDMLANAIGRQFGRILQWTPNTTYYGPTTIRGLKLAGDTVKHDTGVYNVLVDFISDASFEERINGALVMSRVTLDSDLQYLELTGSAAAPVIPGTAILRYPVIRPLDVFKQYELPNVRLGQGLQQWHRAICNADITTDLVLQIKNVYNGGESIIGDIIFTAPAVPAPGEWVDGVITFNDIASGAEATTRLHISTFEMLVIEADTVPVELQFVSVNLLGQFMNYQSPYFNIPA